jgi:small subunit ribosomal protein S20
LARPKTPIKRHRQSLRNRERNRSRRSAVHTVVRKVREHVEAGATDEAKDAVREASSILDRAARRRAIHPNKAARQKSRLARAASGKTAPAAAPRKRATRSRAKSS